MIKRIFQQSIEWVKNNRVQAIILLTIILLAAFLRLYKIGGYMTFLGDEGRDAIIVRRLLVKLDLILVGPGTSIGNMYLGPLYYYMMAPALLVAAFSPVGPAVMIALLGVVTVFMVWYIARDWFGEWAGVVASLLYATSPVVIIYSKSSWNPNIMPFFSLLVIYAVWKIWREKNWTWLIVASVAMAFVLQSHYLGLLLMPVVGIYYFFTLKASWGKEAKRRQAIKISAVSLIVFTLLMSPLVIFDARHGWRNFQAMRTFFTQRQTTVTAKPWTRINELDDIAYEASARLVSGTNENLGIYVAWLIAAAILWFLAKEFKNIREKKPQAYLLIVLWMGIGILGLTVYKQEIYDHYYGFFFTAPFLLLGGILQAFIDKKKTAGMVAVAGLVGVLLYFNFMETPIRYEPANQLKRSRDVAEKIIEKSEGKSFNIAVIAERNYEGAYQYFLEKESSNIKLIDPQREKETVGQYLFVVCELPEEKCDPVNNPKAEVANFGWSKIDETWNIDGVILYKLVHAK